jgi:isopenicillin N synthase-like dioxygenase
MSNIPTLSLQEPREKFVERLLDACRTYGFFYLTDLPFQAGLTEEVWRASEALFLTQGEEADGQRNASRDRQGHTGYTAVNEEKLDTNKDEGDKKESFYIATPLSRQRLPAILEPYTEALEELFKACREVCMTLLEAAAVALKMSDHRYFVDRHNGYDDRLRLLHYPPSPINVEAIRAGAHTDYGSFTVLFQRDVSGLQVLVDDRWIDVEPPARGTVVVNVADALEFWSEGVLCSAQHRVVMPRTQNEAVSRFSIAFFCQPDAHADLTPVKVASIRRKRTSAQYLDELKRKGINSASAELTGGQHLQARLQASYGL